MKIAYDASELIGYTGINVYTRNLVAALATRYSKDRFELITTRKRTGRIREYFNLEHGDRIDIVNPLPNRLALGRLGVPLVETQFNRIFREASRECDLLHITDPYHFPRGIRNIVVTIHDLIPLYPGRWLAPTGKRRFERRLRAIVHSNATIVVPSEFVRNELIEYFSLDADRIFVTHEAAGPKFVRKTVDDVDLLRHGIRPDDHYILYVGRIDVRKNVSRLMEAFNALPEDLRQKTKLVLVVNGSPERVSAFREMYSSPNIIHLQNVSDSDLALLMNQALGLAFVSFFEGFGIPLAEAMACGCPVITSNTTSMPEIAGDAALLVDPYNTSEIRAALERLITDAELRRDLSQRALDRSRLFSWDRCAQQTHAAYEAALAK